MAIALSRTRPNRSSATAFSADERSGVCPRPRSATWSASSPTRQYSTPRETRPQRANARAQELRAARSPFSRTSLTVARVGLSQVLAVLVEGVVVGVVVDRRGGAAAADHAGIRVVVALV